MSSCTGKMKTIHKDTKSKMVLKTGSKPVTVPERNQTTPKGESPIKRLARKHTNMIITLANHIHTVTKLILFLVFQKTHLSRHSDGSVCSILAAQIELNDKATQFKLDVGAKVVAVSSDTCVITQRVLASLDINVVLKLSTDVSSYGLGAVLLQQNNSS